MNSIGTVGRWAVALATAGALLGGSGGVAQAAPVSGTEGLVELGSTGLPPGGPLLGPDGSRAYAVAEDTDLHLRVHVVNTVTDRTVATVDLGQSYGSRQRPALSADGSRLYVVNGQTLSVIDAVEHRVLGTVTLPDEPRPTGWGPGVIGALAVNGSTVYVAQDGPAPGTSAPTQGRLWAVDTVHRTVTGSTVLPGGRALSVVVRPGGRSAYVSTEVGVVHLDTGGALPAVVGTVPDSAHMDGLALTPDGTALYAVNDVADGSALRIDPAHDTVTARLALTTGYAQLGTPVVSADGTRLYVTDAYPADDPAVLAFDTATGTEVAAEDVRGFDLSTFSGLAIGPDGATMYATGLDDNGSGLQIFDF
ncbi:YncE family protein [Kitasatospora sp. NPDC058965]|uniref:YncE family protein n=1 Tax=Kitasatospora sp. NPDC058965 TaxID=3346682 RepID=UPI0036807B40